MKDESVDSGKTTTKKESIQNICVNIVDYPWSVLDLSVMVYIASSILVVCYVCIWLVD
jgi:hypothetical protein